MPLMTSLFLHLGFCYDYYIRVTSTSHCFFCVETLSLFFEDISEILKGALINTFQFLHVI